MGLQSPQMEQRYIVALSNTVSVIDKLRTHYNYNEKVEDSPSEVAVGLRLSTPTPALISSPTPSPTYINITNVGNLNIVGPTTITDN